MKLGEDARCLLSAVGRYRDVCRALPRCLPIAVERYPDVCRSLSSPADRCRSLPTAVELPPPPIRPFDPGSIPPVRPRWMPRTQCRNPPPATWARLDTHSAAAGPHFLDAELSIAALYAPMLMRGSRIPRPATDWPHLAALAARVKMPRPGSCFPRSKAGGPAPSLGTPAIGASSRPEGMQLTSDIRKRVGPAPQHPIG